MSKAISARGQRYLIALRQLALIAPSGRMAVHEAIILLRNLAGFDTATLFWLDENCETIDVNATYEYELLAWQDFLENFVGKEELVKVCGFSLAEAHKSGSKLIVASEHRDESTFLRSEFFNRICTNIDFGWALALNMRTASGKPLASLVVARPFHAPDFNSDEIGIWTQAHPWLEHLLRKDSIPVPDTTDFTSTNHATLLIDANGKLRLGSAGALAILHQAANIPFVGESLNRSLRGDIGELLKDFGNRVAAALSGKSVQPPFATINNRWGRFHLRAYALNDLESGARAQISLHIERQVPLWLRLFSAPRFLALSPRERETCLHLLSGLSHTAIAQEMNVKSSTVIYFIRTMYLRLGITRHSDLISALTVVEH